MIKSIGRAIGRVSNKRDEEEADENDVIAVGKSSRRSGSCIRWSIDRIGILVPVLVTFKSDLFCSYSIN